MPGLVITLVEAGHNRLRYLLNAEAIEGATTVAITTTGAASPDLLTDSLYGPVKVCANAFTSGLGQLAAGAKTQAQARAIWAGDQSDTVLGNGKVPRCITRLVQKDTAGISGWQIDVNVDASGHPVINVTNAGVVSSAYLDVFSAGAIGL